jgi:hypothetical protein
MLLATTLPLTLQIQATDSDLDGSANSEVFFFLTNNTDFDIDVNSAAVRSLREFDYEMEQSFDLVVVAMDNTTNPLDDTAQLTIYITDINDNAPYFIDFPFNVSYPENLGIGSLITTIRADDLDSGINQEVIYNTTYCLRLMVCNLTRESNYHTCKNNFSSLL